MVLGSLHQGYLSYHLNDVSVSYISPVEGCWKNENENILRFHQTLLRTIIIKQTTQESQKDVQKE